MERTLEMIVEEMTTANTLPAGEEKKIIADTDVISLNVGGQQLATIRSTLTRVNHSILAVMFNGQWEEKLPHDDEGNIFLDFNPILFEHLLEQLRLMKNEELIEFSSPISPSLQIPFEKMLRKLGILLPSSIISNDVRQINVAGTVITTRQNIADQLSNLTKDFFLDSHPDQIRRKINQLRGESSVDLTPITTEENTAIFNATTSPTSMDYSDGICARATWNTTGVTVAGGNGQGSELNQLDHPMGIYLDDSSSIYIADTYNHRIIKWLPGASQGEILLHNNESKTYVSKVVVHRNGTIYYCDRFHHHIGRWFANEDAILLSNTCWGLALDQNDSLYISGHDDHRVIQWPRRTIVAGGNGDGDDIDQLSSPYQIFVDRNQTIYIADYFNHRISKWFEDSKEGLIVAGGNGYGDGLEQLKLPHAVIVDQMGTMYIVDFGNDRIIRWFKHSTNGQVLVGNNGSGNRTNQLSDPYDLAFDREGNLYVADTSNHRIQMYRIDKSACESSN